MTKIMFNAKQTWQTVSGGRVRIFRAMLKYLDQYKIGTRLLFAGNLMCQPHLRECNYRVSGELANNDKVMRGSFWIGAYPGLSEKMQDVVVEKIDAFFSVNFRRWSPGAAL